MTTLQHWFQRAGHARIGRRARYRRAFLAALALLLCVELLLRLSLGLGSPVIYQLDPAAGYVPAGEQQTTRFGSHVAINRYGMRSEEVGPMPQPGDVRMLFVGDSVTFGPTYVDQEDLFVSRIAADLGSHGRGSWEALNASAPGWATGNELGFLRSRGTFGASFVLLVINTGDLDQPLAQIDGSGSFPLQRPPSALWEAVSRYLLPRLGLAARAVDPGASGNADEVIPVAQVLANINEARRIAEQAGARFVLVYVPATGPAWRAEHWQREKQELDRWARDNDVLYVDATAAMARQPADSVYFDGIHLRPDGHRILAREIEGVLQ